MLEEIEKDIANFKIIISEKDKQLYDLKIILKNAKNTYQQVTEENKQLKQYIMVIKQQQEQQQQQRYFSRPEKYKHVVYEEASDSDLEENQQETHVVEEEIEEKDTNLEQEKQQE